MSSGKYISGIRALPTLALLVSMALGATLGGNITAQEFRRAAPQGRVEEKVKVSSPLNRKAAEAKTPNSKSQVVYSRDFTNSRSLTDPYSHGTHVASSAAGHVYGIIPRDGIILGERHIASDGIVLRDGIILGDGRVISDGVIPGGDFIRVDGIILGDLLKGTAILARGDNTASMRYSL